MSIAQSRLGTVRRQMHHTSCAMKTFKRNLLSLTRKSYSQLFQALDACKSQPSSKASDSSEMTTETLKRVPSRDRLHPRGLIASQQSEQHAGPTMSNAIFQDRSTSNRACTGV